MSFVTVQFAVFFLAVAAIYFALPGRARTWLLLVASYVFYGAWNGAFLWLIAFTTGVDYLVGRALASTPATRLRRRKMLLALSIFANLGTLFVFKYFNFFSHSLHALLTALGLPVDLATLNVILPVGISFYTFQSLAYLIDVYRGQIEAERDPVRFFTFIAFFPQLVAGPIERASHLLPQFRITHRFDRLRTVDGLRAILWGVFKKVVVADRLAIYVNTVYAGPERFSGETLLLATFFFGFQVYADFSGYTDIAVGTARILGFDLMENFRQPYLATSVREFWRRWHISLWTWFRDYLYIPLGGNRSGFARQLLNIMIVYLVSGLWHGASWTFVMWGAINGAWVSLEMLAERHQLGKRLGIRLPPLAGWAVMFAVISLSRTFFRAESFESASYIVGHYFVFDPRLGGLASPFADAVLPARAELLLAFGSLALFLGADVLASRRKDGLALLHVPPRTLRWAVYYTLSFGILLSLAYGLSTQEFIYFQF